MSDDHLLNIGAFSLLTGLSITALRHYDEIGLLHPATVDANTAYRRYALEQVATGRLIRALRDVSVKLLDEHRADIPTTIWKRCCHVVRENQRTTDAARALTDGNLVRMKVLMRESHESLRDLYEVSCRELDIMVESAEGLPGFCGGRMTGGGFGGCTINLVQKESASQFAEQIAGRYRKATGVDPQIYRCSAEDGAQILR